MEDFRIDRRYRNDFGEAYNERLRDFEKSVPNAGRMPKGDFEALIGELSFHKRDTTYLMLALLHTLKDPQRLRQVLLRCWFNTELIEDQSVVLQALRVCEFISANPQSRPTQALTIYRGCIRDYERRCSWTTSIDYARFFAVRNARHYKTVSGRLKAPLVFRATIDPHLALGEFSAEREVLVDYERIYPVLVEILDIRSSFDVRSNIMTFRPDRPPRYRVSSSV